MNKLPPLRTTLRKFSLTNGDWTKCWPKPDYGPMEVQRSGLMNGIKLAAAKPLGAQMGACTIMFQAGSRYETDDEIGVGHFLRIASSASGLSYSAFSKSRYLTQHGGILTCSNDRQSIAFTLQCPVTKFCDMKKFLLDTAVRGCYKDHEIEELKPKIWDDLHRISPEQRAIDLVQRACWGGSLSNSMFCEYERIDIMTGEVISNFVRENMRTNQCTIASVGIPFEETMKIAEAIEAATAEPPDRCDMASFPRRGYELYDLGPNSPTWIALAIPGCGVSDLGSLLKHSIIASACGTGNIQMGQHELDRTPQTPLGLISGNDVYTNYKAFNISYKETGVFGILAKTRPISALNVAMAATEFLTNISELTFKQIEVGKQRLKLSLALNDEDSVKISESLALQLASKTQIDSASDAIAMVDAISLAEVSCVAKELACKCGDMAAAVVGDISCIPHDKDLFNP